MATRLYVGNLSYETTETELQDLFAEVGPVQTVMLPTDRNTGRMRGFGFVEMTNDADAQEAIRRFDGYMLRDRQIKVNEAQPRDDRGGGGRGGTRGSGPGGSGGYSGRGARGLGRESIDRAWRGGSGTGRGQMGY